MNSCFVFPPYRSGSCSISTVLHFVSALSFPVVFLIRDSRAKSEGLYKNWIEQEYTAVDYRAASGCSCSALEAYAESSRSLWRRGNRVRSCVGSSAPRASKLFLGSQVRLAEPEPVFEPPLARVLFVPELGQLWPSRSIAVIVGVLSHEAHDGQGPLLHPSVVAPLNNLLALAISLANSFFRDPGRKVQREDPTVAMV